MTRLVRSAADANHSLVDLSLRAHGEIAGILLILLCNHRRRYRFFIVSLYNEAYLPLYFGVKPGAVKTQL